MLSINPGRVLGYCCGSAPARGCEPVRPRAAVIAGFAVILGLAVTTDLVARRAGSGVQPPAATLAARRCGAPVVVDRADRGKGRACCASAVGGLDGYRPLRYRPESMFC